METRNGRALTGIVFVLLLLMAGCMPVQPLPAGVEKTVPSGSLDGAALQTDRLLVKGTDGNLYTMDPDGTGVVAHTAGASDSLQYLQPTWSPAADQIAWTNVEFLTGDATTGGATHSSLSVAPVSGGGESEFDVPFPPFYISWGPDASQLAFLSSWSAAGSSTMALRLVDLGEGGDSVQTLAEGQPFYFSWSPDGKTLLTHSLNERLDLQQVDGARTPLQRSDARFPAPTWFRSGDRLLYAVAEGNDQRLIVAGLDGAEMAEVTRFDGNIAFTLSPDEERTAYVVTPVQTGLAALAPLYVVDLASGATRQLTDRPVVAFFWSPDGEKLAFLQVERAEDEDYQFRWRVWDGTRTTDYGVVLPTETFLRRYLAFFDQYAQSMTLWSPDSSAFTYAGFGLVGGEGEEPGALRGPGVWVQALNEDAPRWVGRGEYAAWSPR